MKPSSKGCPGLWQRGKKLKCAGSESSKRRRTKARTGRNPATGQSIEIQRAEKLHFERAKNLKSAWPVRDRKPWPLNRTPVGSSELDLANSHSLSGLTRFSLPKRLVVGHPSILYEAASEGFSVAPRQIRAEAEVILQLAATTRLILGSKVSFPGSILAPARIARSRAAACLRRSLSDRSAFS